MRITHLLLHEVGPFADHVEMRFPQTDGAGAEFHMLSGSGKSTALYALAQMFGLGREYLVARMWSDDSLALVSGSGQHALSRRTWTRPREYAGHGTASWVDLQPHTLASLMSDEGASETRTRLEVAVSDITGREVRLMPGGDSSHPIRVVLDGHVIDQPVLPRGLTSILGWLTAAAMDAIDASPENPHVIFVEDADAHMHPEWQRRLLPTVRDLLPSVQVFLSTNSPLIVGSISGAWVHRLELRDGRATSSAPVRSGAGKS